LPCSRAQHGNPWHPFDKEILRLAAELNRTVVVYGSPEAQAVTRGKLTAAEAAPAAVAADRVTYNLSSGGRVIQGRGDLVSDAKDGVVDLAQVTRPPCPWRCAR